MAAYEDDKDQKWAGDKVVVSEVVPGQPAPAKDVWGDLEGGVNYRGLGW